jgi:hypothetical protein
MAGSSTLGNELPKYATVEKLRAAVLASGLPVQAKAASILRANFAVDEEWAYVDRNSGAPRTLDMLATHGGWTLQRRGAQPRADPMVDVLIECKQSQAPYVFIRAEFAGRPTSAAAIRFPAIAGLRTEEIEISTDDTGSTWRTTVIQALGLERHAFLASPAPYSRYVSRALPIRNGEALDFGGSEAYSSTVEPLLSALAYFRRHVRPLGSFAYLHCHAAFAVCVLAAPMVLATPKEGGDVDIEMAPWIRLMREVAAPQAHPFERSRRFVIDYVHIGYLETYLTDHLLPFAREFEKRGIARDSVIYTGRGFVSGMDARDPRLALYPDLKPLPRARQLGIEWRFFWAGLASIAREAMATIRKRSSRRKLRRLGGKRSRAARRAQRGSARGQRSLRTLDC